MTTQERRSTMEELHHRIEEAIDRTMARENVSRKEAFTRHMNELREKTPNVFAAYAMWLLEDVEPAQRCRYCRTGEGASCDCI